MSANFTSRKLYDIVVLSGGGQRGIGEVGALHYHWEKGNLDNVKIYAGTSVGSVICLMLICGYTPQDIFAKVYNISNFFSSDSPIDLWGLVSNYGILDISPFINIVKDMIIEKLGSIPSFGDLELITGKSLIVTGSNISLQKADYFSPKSHPTMSVIEAVKISCNLPIFKKIKFDGCYYSDGGLVDNFPIDISMRYFEKCYSLNGYLTHPNVLGIVIATNEKKKNDEEFTLVSYLYNIMVLPMTTMTKTNLKNIDPVIDVVRLSFDNVPIFDVSIPSTTKMEMWLKGYIEAKIAFRRELLYIPLDESPLVGSKPWLEDLKFSDSELISEDAPKPITSSVKIPDPINMNTPIEDEIWEAMGNLKGLTKVDKIPWDDDW
jgi:hypothetical protein